MKHTFSNMYPLYIEIIIIYLIFLFQSPSHHDDGISASTVATAVYERQLIAFNGLYDQPWTRISPYLLGLCLGYILHRSKCAFRMHISVVVLGKYGHPQKVFLNCLKSSCSLRLAGRCLSLRWRRPKTTVHRQTERLAARQRDRHHEHGLLDTPVLGGAGLRLAARRSTRPRAAVRTLATAQPTEQLRAPRASAGDAFAAAQLRSQRARVRRIGGELTGSGN